MAYTSHILILHDVRQRHLHSVTKEFPNGLDNRRQVKENDKTFEVTKKVSTETSVILS